VTESSRADLAELWARRGELLLQAGRTEDAVRVLRRGITASPVAARLRLVLAKALARAGRREEAAREAARALDLSAATRSASGRLRAKEVAEARGLAGSG